LRRDYRTTLLHVDHSDAPRLRHFQDRILALLRGPADAFAEEGFPRAGQPLHSRDPGEQPVAEKLEAIEQSNIVYTHALAISEVAEAREEVIIIRPGNAHSTRLVEADAATKEMRVKGKSADWGPQRGLIAVDQAFSKITGPTDSGASERIAKFNCEVLSSIRGGIAVPRNFRVRIQGVTYDVRRLLEASSGPFEDFACREEDGRLIPVEGFAAAIGERLRPGRRPPLYLRDPQGRYWRTDDPETPARGVTDEVTIPLRVLADPGDGRYLTADYDLLAIGTLEHPGEPYLDKARGNVTESYLETIRAINEAVEATGYQGGNVVHHAPESHFTKSEGVDYPNAAFEPHGDIGIIRESPEGQKDRHAKRLFARWKRAGWHLEPNPRWTWGAFDDETGLWPDEDQPDADPGPGHPEPVLGPAATPILLPASTGDAGNAGTGGDDGEDGDGPPSGEAPPQDGDDDLIFGLNENRRLVRFREAAGGRGRLLTEIPKSRNDDGSEVSVAEHARRVLRVAAHEGRQIHFNLTAMKEVAGILANAAHRDKVTSQEQLEVCFLASMGAWRVEPRFYCHGQPAPNPCDWADRGKDPCDP